MSFLEMRAGPKSPQQAARSLLNAAGRVEARARLAVDRALSLYVRRARVEAPLGSHYDADGTLHRPGTLKNSIQFEVRRRGQELGRAYSNAPQAIWVIRGIHQGGKDIFPTRRKFLRFWWPRAGATVFALRVHHPGTIPNPFHRRAFDAEKEAMVRAMAGEVRNIRFDLL